ncbi:hypothetical protein MXMO3_02847 [Maritalea myrionectae]|uniref:Uncharacterized protein n=1 Tax=Maritalea myrionectae TaxID=454601 RepID=A0A2R4MH24_9HYPH|nr:hypothetical protein MXMO3_02847 [Maritalea myrionectae]
MLSGFAVEKRADGNRSEPQKGDDIERQMTLGTLILHHALPEHAATGRDPEIDGMLGSSRKEVTPLTLAECDDGVSESNTADECGPLIARELSSAVACTLMLAAQVLLSKLQRKSSSWHSECAIRKYHAELQLTSAMLFVRCPLAIRQGSSQPWRADWQLRSYANLLVG